MTVENIIKAVRWCIDEESINTSNLDNASAYDFDGSTTDTGLMNNIIRHKIMDAIRWVSLYAPAEQLSGGSGNTGDIDIIKEDTLSAMNNVLTPSQPLIRLLRVKGSNWHRAILGDSLIKEDSDEYLQLRDVNGAAATDDRPQAALVNTRQKKVEVWPGTGTFTLTYIINPSLSSVNVESDSTTVNIPDAVETSFIYYLAYLLLSAYGDARSNRMLEIAMQGLGRSEDRQRQ